MKSILYVGATLMIGASIYGFVDYRKTSQTQAFTGMYESKEVNNPVTEENTIVAPEKKEVAPVKKVVKKSHTGNKEVVKAKSSIITEPVKKISPAAVEINTATIKETPTIKDPVTIKETETIKGNASAEKFEKAKKKKLNHKLFSRGSLRDDVPEKVLKVKEPVKAVTKQ